MKRKRESEGGSGSGSGSESESAPVWIINILEKAFEMTKREGKISLRGFKEEVGK